MNNHAERLNEKALTYVSDAIVRTLREMNRKKPAEMAGSYLEIDGVTNGLLQEVSVDFKGDLKKLYTQSQFPIATARGKMDVAGKAKIVNYDPDPINQLFWAQTIASGMQIPVDQELDSLNATATTINVTNSATFAQNNGVVYQSGVSAGQVLLQVSTVPNKGQYSVNVSSGVYTFAATDNSTSFYISYTYTNATRGKTITLTSQVMGYAPVCAVDVWANFRNKVLGIRLNSCTFGSWTCLN